MCIHYPDQVFAQCGGILKGQAPEAGFQLLVEAFGLAVGFRVIS